MTKDRKLTVDVIAKLPKYTKLFYRLYRSKKLSKRHKLRLSMGFAYGLLPINLIPDIIPVAGQLDNLLMLLSSLEKTLKLIDKSDAENFLAEAGITIDGLTEDKDIIKGTLKSMGRGTVKLTANSAKIIGLNALYIKRKLWRKKPY
jgi:uncharacterized membrane protein YkvA (DUF1232 family)